MSPFDGVNNYYEYKMSGGGKSSGSGGNGSSGGCLSGCATIVAAFFIFVVVLTLLSLFQRLCKPPNWCKIKTLVWRFYYVKKKDEPRGKSKKGKAP
jgi:hypothetical protein